MSSSVKWWSWELFGWAMMPLEYLVVAIVWPMDTYHYFTGLSNAIKRPVVRYVRWYLAMEPQ